VAEFYFILIALFVALLLWGSSRWMKRVTG
jgi:multiple sugar transport system permease protein